MRIVAGRFRGRVLVSSDHLKGLRPTTDKNREALFSILSSAKFIKEYGFDIVGAKVLDVCCGTGAVGLEAISRGAKSVTFIDYNHNHLQLVKKNLMLLGLGDCYEIIHADVKKISRNNQNFDLIFIDPPYAEDYLMILQNLRDKDWFGKNSLIVVEANKSFCQILQKIDFLKLVAERSYGLTTFFFFVNYK